MYRPRGSDATQRKVTRAARLVKLVTALIRLIYFTKLALLIARLLSNYGLGIAEAANNNLLR